jgi:hypothetical protein
LEEIMRSWTIRMAAIAVGSAALFGDVRTGNAAEGLALRRVLLSSGGVGYFEYEATVDGNVDLPLDVRLDQVDDVLKSIVVFDDRGRVGSIDLPSREADALRDTPLDDAALSSEPALLDALRGAEVRASVGADTIAGRVLSVTDEDVALPRGGTVTRHRLAILTSDGLRSMLLEDVQSLSFTDAKLEAQIDTALAASLTSKEQGRRELRVHLDGAGARTVRVGYVAAVPLWKATYRLVLPADTAAKKASMQAWAVLENQSGAPWSNVDLTLVAGNPVTFRQALYETYYVDRPEVPVEVVGRILPPLDEGAVSGGAKVGDHGMAPPQAPFAPGPFVAAPAAAPIGVAPTRAAVATEAMTYVTFHAPAPVSLDTGRTDLVPLFDGVIQAERVALYQPETASKNPLSSVELTNDTGTGLPPGVVSLYEQGAAESGLTYAGDARISTLPAAESRFLSYGVDDKVRIDHEDRISRMFTRATIAGGVLTLQRSEQRSTVYTIQGAAHEPRVVILEHPRIAGFDLQDRGEKLLGTDDAHYRLRVDVPRGKTVTLTVTLSRPISDSVTIAALSTDALGAYASSTELPSAVRETFHALAKLRAVVDDKAAALADLEAEVARITAEQARIREDIKVVPAGNALQARYLGELAAQEDRLQQIGEKLDAAKNAVADAKRALAERLRNLAL